jgi:hypothetical protein
VEHTPLRRDHTWRARPGCRIFVADRGALRFDYPDTWVVQPDATSVSFFDRDPPDDECRLTVSIQQLPPVDWSSLAVASLLTAVVPGGVGEGAPGPVHVTQRGDLELAWRDLRSMDDASARQACSRTCLARGGEVQALLTFDFWVDDLERCDRVWRVVLDTLELGRTVADPTRGPLVS